MSSGKKISSIIKQEILLATKHPEATISSIAKRYNISPSTIRKWQKQNIVKEVDPSNEFVELGLSSSKPNVLIGEESLKKELILTEVSLSCENVNMNLSGSLKSKMLISLIKIMEETCCN